MGRFIPLGDLASTPQRLVFAPAIPDSIKEQLEIDLDALEAVLDLIRVRILTVTHENAEPPIAGMNDNGEAVMAVSTEKEVEIDSSAPRIIGTDLLCDPSTARRFTWEDVDLTRDLSSIQSSVADIPHGLQDATVWAAVLDRFIKDQILIPTAWEQTMTFAARDIQAHRMWAGLLLSLTFINRSSQPLGAIDLILCTSLGGVLAEAVSQRNQANSIAMKAGEEAFSRIRHFLTVLGFDPFRYGAARRMIEEPTFVVAQD